MKLDYEIVVTTNGVPQRMDVKAFLALPLDARIRAVLEHRVEVYDRGDRVPADVALNAIRLAARTT